MAFGLLVSSHPERLFSGRISSAKPIVVVELAELFIQAVSAGGMVGMVLVTWFVHG